MTITGPNSKPIWTKPAAAAACALLATSVMASAGAASASADPARASSASLRPALHRDLSRYLAARRTAEHISAVSLRVTFPGRQPGISLATGTTRFGGGPPVRAGALWQVGSNTKAFTAVIMLQLEAERRLSIDDPIGKWLPQYRAWRHITIRQLLDMTSRIPDYLYQPAFGTAFAANPRTRFTASRLVSYVVGLPLGPAGWHYTNTDYILAQMIIEKVTHHTYADQLTKRIITPLKLRTTCLAPDTCPPSDAARMPAGYFYLAGAAPSLFGKPMPRLALTWAQATGGIVSSLPDLATWDRALYRGQLLPPRQQRQLESLVSEATGKPIRRLTTADPNGFGLGVQEVFNPQAGTFWAYEGQAFGSRVIQYFFPSTGLLIAVAANSSASNDDLAGLAGAVYGTLHKAGTMHIH